MFRWLIGGILALLIANLLGFLLLFSSYESRFFQGIYIDGLALGGLNKEQALKKILRNQKNLPEFILLLELDNIKIATTSTTLQPKIDYSKTLDDAYQLGRVGNILQRIKAIFDLYQTPQNFVNKIQFNQNAISNFLQLAKEQIDIAGELPSATLGYSHNANSLKIFAGKIGRDLPLDINSTNLNQLLVKFANNQVASAQTSQIIFNPTTTSTSIQLSDLQIEEAKQYAKQFVGKQIVLETLDRKFVIGDQEIISFLSFPETFYTSRIEEKVAQLAQIIDRPAQDAVFNYDQNTLKVIQFVPDKPGLALNQTTSQELITQALRQIAQSANQNNQENKEKLKPTIQLPIVTTQAKKNLASTNNLGINQRIGFGESYYAHSIPNRVHNVAITTQKINYTIVPPGAEFSFNKTLGEVSARTGYKSAYIIKGGRTELSDGGGVCQVSTTMFRALLDAGVKITKRKPHSYRVSYYELDNDPGFDATVYSGDVDLRFINDTPAHLLIHTNADSKNLYMTVEIYGTSDGRTSEVVNYQKWGYRPPPAPVFIPDPALPTGKRVQVDWSASGINAKFTHVIKDKDGNSISETTYESYYRPWSAKFLVGM